MLLTSLEGISSAKYLAYLKYQMSEMM